MAGGGLDLARYQDNDAWTLPIPATFVVGSDGVVVARFVEPDFRRRGDVEESDRPHAVSATRVAEVEAIIALEHHINRQAIFHTRIAVRQGPYVERSQGSD
jgi:hypothetical protein